MLEDRINKIIQEIKNNGSEINYDEILKVNANNIIKKDYSLEEVLKSIANNVEEETSKILNAKNKYGTQLISGISSCIFLPDFSNNGEYKLTILGGSRDRNINIPIDSKTMFDVASITKLFTLLLLFKLEQEGIINLNDKIIDINPEFKGMEDFSFNDLVRLHGIIYTDGRIDDASNEQEALEKLKTAFLKSNTREENNYTDLGAIIIGKTLEKIISEKLNRNITFKEIMNEYLIKPLGLNNTMFNPTTGNTTGSGNMDGIVHDPKARILGGAIGSAGIFTTSEDLAKLSHSIYSLGYINKYYIKKMGEITFPNAKQSNKGNLGIYVKHPLGLEKTYTPSEFSTGSFSHQGWTGSVANFDPNNLIHQNILVNAIYTDEDIDKVRADKPIGFGSAFDNYLGTITQNTMLMLVVKQFYNKYYNVNDNIEDARRVK